MSGNGKQVVTRFAPSPTGFLHIGGARTALFNWLYARHHQGRFLLRIEDTDRARSTHEATEAIFEGLRWLGLDWDGEAISQFSRADRHRAVANDMLANDRAYRCYATKDEIDAFRAQAREKGEPPLFRSPWRDPVNPEPDRPYVIRLRAPQIGETIVEDSVQGRVSWKNETLDDLILVRSDGTPTYMFAVVVDDHDMGITQIIRGDDHLTNAARQSLIYRAMDWVPPTMAHVPLINGPDGAKLSKRHGALGVEAYREMGFQPAALRNYLARLGWSHGDDEFFSTEQAVLWFNLEQIGRSPARFDIKKLENLSGQHIRASEPATLVSQIREILALQQKPDPDPVRRDQLLQAMPGLQERAKTILELIELAHYILGSRPFDPDEKSAKHLTDESREMLRRLTERLQNASWTPDNLEAEMKTFAEAESLKLGKVAQPVRVALTGRSVSPSVFDVMITLGPDESLARLADSFSR